MMKYFLLIIYLFSASMATAQTKTKDGVVLKAARLKKLLAQADTMRSWDNWDNVAVLNNRIAAAATDLFSSPAIVQHNIDSLLPGVVHSKDKRLWIFNWFENTGGSFQSHRSVIHYRTSTSKPKAKFLDDFGFEGTGFCTGGGPVYAIHKLPHPTKSLYLCLFNVRGCGSCCAQVASIIELTKEGINLNYPGFQKAPVKGSSNAVRTNSACYLLDSRCGSITRFGYNPKTFTLHFTYNTDDNTPVSQEETWQVKGRLRWNGKAFQETIMKQ